MLLIGATGDFRAAINGTHTHTHTQTDTHSDTHTHLDTASSMINLSALKMVSHYVLDFLLLVVFMSLISTQIDV